MKLLRFSLLAISLLGLAGWYGLHKPHSPTDDLPQVANIAFQIDAPTEQAGLSLAEAARNWRGVTAATYNPQSDLLVLMYTSETDVPTLQSGLRILAGRPIVKKDFDTPGAPKCPVPAGLLADLPGYLLAVGAAALALFFVLSYRRSKVVLAA